MRVFNLFKQVEHEGAQEAIEKLSEEWEGTLIEVLEDVAQLYRKLGSIEALRNELINSGWKPTKSDIQKLKNFSYSNRYMAVIELKQFRERNRCPGFLIDIQESNPSKRVKRFDLETCLRIIDAHTSLRSTILDALQKPRSLRELYEMLPEYPEPAIRGTVYKLKTRGLVRKAGNAKFVAV